MSIMTTIFDGRALAEELARLLEERAKAIQPTLAIISVAPDFATTKYLAIKKRFAERIGVALLLTELPETATTEDVVAAIMSAQSAHGIVLQLPFPPHVDVARALAVLPKDQDVDVIGDAGNAAFEGGNHILMPPVIGAIAEIAQRQNINFSNTNVCVVGKGRLVGAPAALWARAKGAQVTPLGKEDDIKTAARNADIIILGAGSPSLLTPDMLKLGVAIFDAGTSEDGGKLAGDADPSCADIAGLFTPVPGGIGPVAVAKLFENLIVLAEKLAMKPR